MTQAGWYPDPQDQGSVRYFDGQAWTEHRQPAAPAAAPAMTPTEPAPPAAAPPAAAPPAAAPPAEPWGLSAPGPAWTAPPAPSAPQWGPPAGAWSAPPTMPTAPTRRRRRTPLIIALVVVLVLAGGGVAAWQLLKSSPPSLTYQGKKIANATAVLDQAQTRLATEVSSRHGTSNSQSRCYFAVPTTPAAGAKKSDVATDLTCGPVLFVDGDAGKEYLSYPLLATSTSGGKATLTAADSPTSPDPAARPSTATLKRPDGKTAPSGTGGLTVPKPPAAATTTLTATTLSPGATLNTLTGAEMVSQSTGVKLDSAGSVARYGQGDNARSAPSGYQLQAFQYEQVDGDSGSNDPAPDLSVVIGGGAGRPLPVDDQGSDVVVVAVPIGTSASLVLKADGYTQTLALPSGTPGPNNLTVLTRSNRVATLGKTVSVPVRLSGGGATGTDTWTAKVDTVALQFWPTAHPTSHPTKPGDAFLFPDLTFTDPQDPGGPYGFDTPLVSLKLPDGTVVHARNLATGNEIYNVLEVPGSFTTGTLLLGGSEVVSGVTVSISPAVSIPISIAAG